MKQRVWIPTSEYVGGTSVRRSVDRWTWTRQHGLRVTYRDGLTMRSDWRTLPEFLRALRTGREGPVREL